MTWLVPSQQAWQQHRRGVRCMAWGFWQQGTRPWSACQEAAEQRWQAWIRGEVAETPVPDRFPVSSAAEVATPQALKQLQDIGECILRVSLRGYSRLTIIKTTLTLYTQAAIQTLISLVDQMGTCYAFCRFHATQEHLASLHSTTTVNFRFKSPPDSSMQSLHGFFSETSQKSVCELVKKPYVRETLKPEPRQV